MLNMFGPRVLINSPVCKLSACVFALGTIIFLLGCAPHSAATYSPSPVSNLESPTRTPVVNPFNSSRAGWAYEAYPDASLEKMSGDFAMMRVNGANAVWLGQNNPGQVDANKVEPGLSYAVYAALHDEHDPRHADAQRMYDAVKRALTAARENELQVILPIGYQIQMGDTWNRKYPNELRSTFDGQPLNLYHSGYTASPYSEQYRADITRYYAWVQQELVAPFRDVIVLLSLADEPMGGDYSPAAKKAFAARYGKPMDSLAPDELWQVGEFQSGVIADYAAWSAKEWQRLNPAILTTMSFHGGDTARRVWGLPDVEKLFSETPENFMVTFDAYLHDDLAAKPATPDEAAQLKLFLTTIGNYSRVYNKPIALWGGVNAWGLAQESSSPLKIPDAVTNLLLLFDLPTRAGGKVWGIFAWNYNVKLQGLENYARPTTFDVRAMQVAVERVFPVLRTRAADSSSLPEIAIVIPPRAMYSALGESRAANYPPAWFDTTPYARAFADRDVIVASSPQVMSAAQDAAYFIVPASAGDLDDAALRFLRARLQEGRVILGNITLARALGAPAVNWTPGLARLPDKGGAIYLAPRN